MLHKITQAVLQGLALTDLFSSFAQAEPTEKPPTGQERDLIAEPISPQLIQRFPHLQTYIGQVLLANRDTQLIIAGLAPVPIDSEYHPLIIDILEKKTALWQHANIALPILAKFTAHTGSPLFIQTMDLQASGTRALVSFGLKTKSSGNKEGLITITLEQTEAAAHVVLSRSGRESHLPTWSFMIGAPYGANLYTLGTDEASNKKGSIFTLWHYLGSEAMALMGYQPITVKEYPQKILLEPATKTDGRKYQGFELFFAARKIREFPIMAAAIKDCMDRPLLKNAETVDNYVSGIQTCQKEPQSTAVIKWEGAKSLLAHETNAKLQLMLHNKTRNIVAYLPLNLFAQKDDEKLTIIADNEYDVYVRDTEGLKVVQTFAPKPESETTINLEKFNTGSGRLNIKFDHQQTTPSLLTLLATHDPLGSPLFTPSEGNAHNIGTSPYQLIMSEQRGSLELALSPGSYQGALVNSLTRLYCPIAITISSDKTTTVECTIKEPPVTGVAPPAPIVTPLAASTPTAATSTTKAAAAPTAEVPTAAPPAQGAAQADAPVKKSPPARTLPTVGMFSGFTPLAETTTAATYPAIQDPTNGLYMRLLGGNDNFLQKWQIKQQQISKNNLLVQFANFARENGSQTVLELSCPQVSTTPDELFDIIKHSDVTAVALFGCRSTPMEDRLIILLDRYNQAATHNKPVQLTVAALHDVTGTFIPYLPYMVFDLPQEADSTVSSSARMQELALQAIVSTRYSLSRGAMMHNITTNWTPGHKGQAKGRLTVNLGVSSLGETLAQRVIITSDSGQLLNGPLEGDSTTLENLAFSVNCNKKPRWIRIAVLGKYHKDGLPRSQKSWLDAQDEEFTLASSAYLELNSD